jgi:hypothetical protein
MPQIDITDDTEAYFDAIATEGAYSWDNPGISVPSDVQDCMELLHEVLAGATISASRQQGRLVSISITTSGDQQVFEGLQETFDDAINSHDDLKEGDGYCP